MILINQTFNVSDAQHENWLAWMKSIYMPQLMASGQFLHYKLYKLKNQDLHEGHTYAAQFAQASALYDASQIEKIFQQFEAKVTKEFGHDVLYFRTLLEEIV